MQIEAKPVLLTLLNKAKDPDELFEVRSESLICFGFIVKENKVTRTEGDFICGLEWISAALKHEEPRIQVSLLSAWKYLITSDDKHLPFDNVFERGDKIQRKSINIGKIIAHIYEIMLTTESPDVRIEALCALAAAVNFREGRKKLARVVIIDIDKFNFIIKGLKNENIDFVFFSTKVLLAMSGTKTTWKKGAKLWGHKDAMDQLLALSTHKLDLLKMAAERTHYLLLPSDVPPSKWIIRKVVRQQHKKFNQKSLQPGEPITKREKLGAVFNAPI